MPKEPSKREVLLQAIAAAEQSIGKIRAEGDDKHVAQMIAARNAKISALEREIADIQARFESSAKRLEVAQAHLAKLNKELAEHSSRHEVDRLVRTANNIKESLADITTNLRTLTPEQLATLEAAIKEARQ